MSEAPGRPVGGPGGVEWTFDPWSDRPLVTAAAALGLLTLWLLLASWRLPWLVALAEGVLVAVPLAPAVVPSRCRVEPGGAARRGILGWARRSWNDVRRVERVPIGMLLSPYPKRHWLDATRALTLPMPSARRGELCALVETSWRDRGR